MPRRAAWMFLRQTRFAVPSPSARRAPRSSRTIFGATHSSTTARAGHSVVTMNAPQQRLIGGSTADAYPPDHRRRATPTRTGSSPRRRHARSSARRVRSAPKSRRIEFGQLPPNAGRTTVRSTTWRALGACMSFQGSSDAGSRRPSVRVVAVVPALGRARLRGRRPASVGRLGGEVADDVDRGAQR
ncbi:MAG: hypothetical protein QOD72_3412 [Acidimicrobiaceae bacterium]|jgi:hypothetical protein|nr:hypothetical protein [Acidimicrobiaceae bacterium]